MHIHSTGFQPLYRCLDLAASIVHNGDAILIGVWFNNDVVEPTLASIRLLVIQGCNCSGTAT
jgi:hypothetical protein